MSANDEGHINNLSEEQVELLREFWVEFYEAIVDESETEEFTSPVPSSVTANPNEDLFPTPSAHALATELSLLSGYDHPDALVLRFLRARKWDVKAAVTMAINCVKWRRQFGVAELLMEGEKVLDLNELSSGKSYFMANDKEGRPCCAIHVKLHEKAKVDQAKTEKLTVFTMEVGRLLLEPPVEVATVLFDMTDFGMANMDYNFVKFFVGVLQNYYPESLGAALIINSPWLFNGCWRIIRPWLDPVVAAKVHFVKSSELSDFIDPSKLPERLGGDAPDYEYIPPDPEAEAEQERVRSNVELRDKTWTRFIEAWGKAIKLTQDWAEGNDEAKEEREAAVKDAINAYTELTPFVR
ncbi:hypothetical protein HK104_009192 [Borealophlyctis nickersoniae]|nr:hypothetical protein HK104_009192 [Borealophlyctis nickersoniae]